MKKYLKSFGAFSIGPIIGAVFSFITIPIITYFISPDEYGRVSMFTLLQNVLGMIAYLGLDQAYIKFYHDEENKEKLMLHSIFPAICFSVFVSLSVLFFKEPLAVWLYGSTNDMSCVYILIPYLPFFVIERFILIKYRMEQKGLTYSFFSIFSKAIMLVLSIVTLKYYLCGYQSVIYSTVLSQVISTVFLIFFYLKNEKISLMEWDWIYIKKLLKYGLPLIPATIVGWVLNSMDKIMIRSICDYQQLGLYDVALKIVSVLAIIQSCFATFWSPIAFKWNKEQVETKKFEEVGKILSIIMTTMFMGILTFKEIIIKILSPEYYNAVEILPFLLIYPIMYTVSEVTVVGIYFSGKSFTTIIVAVCSCILNVTLNGLLIPKYGAIGASVATGCSYILFFWLRTIISRKVWKTFSINYYVYITIIIILQSFINITYKGLLLNVLNSLLFISFLLFNRKTIGSYIVKLIRR